MVIFTLNGSLKILAITISAPPPAGKNGMPPNRRKCGTMAPLITKALFYPKVVASPWATNEDQDGYDLRFRSSEYSSSYYRPKLVVTYKRQFNYVYYLPRGGGFAKRSSRLTPEIKWVNGTSSRLTPEIKWVNGTSSWQYPRNGG